MDINQWWPALTPETREWLIANNGDVVSPSIAAQIEAAGGPSGFSITDEHADWIEAVANDEEPTETT